MGCDEDGPVVREEPGLALIASVQGARRHSGGGCDIPRARSHGPLVSKQQVRGLDVVGAQPVLKPGESFEYTSGTAIATPVGTMRGSYQMVRPDGREFEILADATVRIGVETIDRLMALASELVLARNRIVRAAESIEDAGYQAATRQLNLVTSELQEVVMRTRMQPISTVWGKLPRMVRDLSRQLGKHCRIDLEGGDTELDKTLLESIKSPLTHLARNAVDHGIEPPANRLAMGKPAEGRILLRASHEAGQVTVEMTDDGRGIDAAKVRSKAVAQRMATADDISRLSDSQVMQFVFMPGFSTADRVTEVSGRGVGMDVVKSSIESITALRGGGRCEGKARGKADGGNGNKVAECHGRGLPEFRRGERAGALINGPRCPSCTAGLQTTVKGLCRRNTRRRT